MGPIKESLTFDDVTLAPKYSEILPSEVITETKLAKNLTLKEAQKEDDIKSAYFIISNGYRN